MMIIVVNMTVRKSYNLAVTFFVTEVGIFIENSVQMF